MSFVDGLSISLEESQLCGIYIRKHPMWRLDGHTYDW